jgi:hypothetical protein
MDVQEVLRQYGEISFCTQHQQWSASLEAFDSQLQFAVKHSVKAKTFDEAVDYLRIKFPQPLFFDESIRSLTTI